MSFFIQNPHVWFAAVVLAVGGWVHAQEGTGPMAAGSGMVTGTNTNLAPAAAVEQAAKPERRRHHSLRVTALKRLEQDLARTFGFNKQGSGSRALDDLHRLSVPAAAPRIRAKEEDDRERDWAFMNPNELAKPPTAEEFLNLKNLSPEEKERNRLSAMERYFDTMDQQRTPGSRDLKQRQDDLFGSRWGRADEVLNRRGDLDSGRGLEQEKREMALREMLGLESIPTASAGNRGLDSLLGFGKADAPPVSDALRPSRQNFEAIYNTPRPMAGAPGSSLGIPATGALSPYESTPTAPETRSTAAGVSGLSSYLNPAPPTRSSMGALSLPGSPGYSPGTTLPDFNSQVLNAWNPARTPPREEPATRPRTTTPPSQFNTPQRNF